VYDKESFKTEIFDDVMVEGDNFDDDFMEGLMINMGNNNV